MTNNETRIGDSAILNTFPNNTSFYSNFVTSYKQLVDEAALLADQMSYAPSSLGEMTATHQITWQKLYSDFHLSELDKAEGHLWKNQAQEQIDNIKKEAEKQDQEIKNIVAQLEDLGVNHKQKHITDKEFEEQKRGYQAEIKKHEEKIQQLDAQVLAAGELIKWLNGWSKHGEYAYFTNEGLLQALNIKQQQIALVKKNKKAIKEAHNEASFKSEINALEQERQKIVMAMMVRLEMAKREKNIGFADPVHYLFDLADQVGNIISEKAKKDLPGVYQFSGNPKIVEQFAVAIRKYGDRQQIKELQKMSSIYLSAHAMDNSVLVEIYSDTATGKVSLPGLGIAHYLPGASELYGMAISQLLEVNAAIFNNKHTQEKVTFDNFDKHPNRENLRKCDSILTKVSDDAEKILDSYTGIAAIFRPLVRIVIKRFQQIIEEARHQLIFQELDFAHKVNVDLQRQAIILADDIANGREILELAANKNGSINAFLSIIQNSPATQQNPSIKAEVEAVSKSIGVNSNRIYELQRVNRLMKDMRNQLKNLEDGYKSAFEIYQQGHFEEAQDKLEKISFSEININGEDAKIIAEFSNLQQEVDKIKRDVADHKKNIDTLYDQLTEQLSYEKLPLLENVFNNKPVVSIEAQKAFWQHLNELENKQNYVAAYHIINQLNLNNPEFYQLALRVNSKIAEVEKNNSQLLNIIYQNNLNYCEKLFKLINDEKSFTSMKEVKVNCLREKLISSQLLAKNDQHYLLKAIEAAEKLYELNGHARWLPTLGSLLKASCLNLTGNLDDTHALLKLQSHTDRLLELYSFDNVDDKENKQIRAFALHMSAIVKIKISDIKNAKEIKVKWDEALALISAFSSSTNLSNSFNNFARVLTQSSDEQINSVNPQLEYEIRCTYAEFLFNQGGENIEAAKKQIEFAFSIKAIKNFSQAHKLKAEIEIEALMRQAMACITNTQSKKKIGERNMEAAEILGKAQSLAESHKIVLHPQILLMRADIELYFASQDKDLLKTESAKSYLTYIVSEDTYKAKYKAQYKAACEKLYSIAKKENNAGEQAKYTQLLKELSTSVSSAMKRLDSINSGLGQVLSSVSRSNSSDQITSVLSNSGNISVEDQKPQTSESVSPQLKHQQLSSSVHCVSSMFHEEPQYHFAHGFTEESSSQLKKEVKKEENNPFETVEAYQAEMKNPFGNDDNTNPFENRKVEVNTNPFENGEAELVRPGNGPKL